MPEPLLTIGAFARAVDLTPSALRHYDECGLLPPAEVDEVTGYRYYTPDLAERARMVARMREAGMSIGAMSAVLDGPADEGRAVLRRFLEEQTSRSARTVGIIEGVLEDLAAPHSQERSTRIDVRGPELAAALRQVVAAADSDATSPLASVLIDVVPGSVDVVATNRYWMAVRTLPLDGPVDEGRAVLSQASALRLAALLDGYDQVALEVSPDRVTVGSEALDVRTGPYPAHRIVLAGLEPTVTRAVLPRAELEDAVRATGRAEVTLALTATGARVKGGSGAPDQSIDATVSGPDVTLCLGSALTLRALATTLGPRIECEVSAPDRPVRLGSPYQRGFLALVMPLGSS